MQACQSLLQFAMVNGGARNIAGPAAARSAAMGDIRKFADNFLVDAHAQIIV